MIEEKYKCIECEKEITLDEAYKTKDYRGGIDVLCSQDCAYNHFHLESIELQKGWEK